MPTTITSTDVVTAFGSYYIDAGQNENNIHDVLREEFTETEDFTVVDTEDTQLREANVAYAEVIQAFQTQFTPKGGVTFTPKTIQLYNIKVDQLFYPDALKNQWMSFMTSNKLDRTEWPFVRWFMEKYVVKQIRADIVKNMYGAVYVAPTAGTAGAASASFTGLKKIINDSVTAGTITTIATGALSATNTTLATQIEAFSAAIPELYWQNPMGIQMSRAAALRYRQGRAKNYNSNYLQSADASAVENFDGYTVNGRASLAGVDKIWATPKENAIMAFKGGANKDIVEVEKVDRQVKVYTDFWMGMGFIDDRVVFTNDRDLS